MTDWLFSTHPEWKKLIKLLKKRRAALRPGSKQTVNLATFKTRTLFTVEMQLSPRRWLPIRFPQSFGSMWYFPDQEMRDGFLKAYEATA